MHKLVLSITAVACLQIGFIIYITTDEMTDNVRLTDVSTQPISLATNPHYTAEEKSIEIASLDEDPFFRPKTGNSRNAAATGFAKTDYAVRRKNTRSARKVRAQPEPFEPEKVIITYAVHKPYKFVEREPYSNESIDTDSIVDRSEIAEQPVIKSQKSDGNPILALIKKPYIWIKALGSKLK
jgi:hypothetical protein